MASVSISLTANISSFDLILFSLCRESGYTKIDLMLKHGGEPLLHIFSNWFNDFFRKSCDIVIVRPNERRDRAALILMPAAKLFLHEAELSRLAT